MLDEKAQIDFSTRSQGRHRIKRSSSVDKIPIGSFDRCAEPNTCSQLTTEDSDCEEDTKNPEFLQFQPHQVHSHVLATSEYETLRNLAEELRASAGDPIKVRGFEEREKQ